MQSHSTSVRQTKWYLAWNMLCDDTAFIILAQVIALQIEFYLPLENSIGFSRTRSVFCLYAYYIIATQSVLFMYVNGISDNVFHGNSKIVYIHHILTWKSFICISQYLCAFIDICDSSLCQTHTHTYIFKYAHKHNSFYCIITSLCVTVHNTWYWRVHRWQF